MIEKLIGIFVVLILPAGLLVRTCDLPPPPPVNQNHVDIVSTTWYGN